MKGAVMKGGRPAKNAVPSADRDAVARLLAERGPIQGDDAAAALGWSADRWWEVVRRFTAWFDCTGRGWVLTEAGRREVGAAGVTP